MGRLQIIDSASDADIARWIEGRLAEALARTPGRVDDPLTIPALLGSDTLLFVIRGADKRAVFDSAATGASDLPVARIFGTAQQPVLCFT